MSQENDDTKLEKINELILDISKGASFSSSAMQQFVELQSEVDSQESTIKYLRGKLKDSEGDLKKTSTAQRQAMETIGNLTSQVNEFHKRNSELADRESQAEVLSMSLSYEQKRVEDHQCMVGLIFRNTELRTKVLGQEMNYQPGCIEIKDEYGNIKQYAESAGYVGVPVDKTSTETKE